MTTPADGLLACFLNTYLPRHLPKTSLEALLEDIRFPVIQIQYHLPKEAVCPREPERRGKVSCQQCYFSTVTMLFMEYLVDSLDSTSLTTASSSRSG